MNDYLKRVFIVLVVGTLLIPMLKNNGDIWDLITVLPFGRQMFNMLATFLNFGSQFPKMSTVVDVWSEILKVFFVAVTKRFLDNVFSAFVADSDHKTHGILVKSIIDLAVVCLASLCFKTLWDYLKTTGIIVYLLAALGINCLFAIMKTTGSVFGIQSALRTLLFELLWEIAQTFFAMVIVIGIVMIIVSPSSSFLGLGLIYILSGLILLMGIKLILDA